MTSSPPFTGFSRAGLRFLRDLAKNNDRQWFTPRKNVYETELLEPLRALVADASVAMKRAKIPLGADPRRSTFRIYRDIRFSPDKSPYKTNLGAFLAHNGNHDLPGGLYIHIEPSKSFLAAGFYQIDKGSLQRWREEIATSARAFESLVRTLERKGLHLSDDPDALKRVPRGFESYAESSVAKYLRRTSFTVSEKVSDDDVATSELIKRIVDFAKRTLRLLEYGWNLS
jgi:uncharacterized protein (TIGR02453 family)